MRCKTNYNIVLTKSQCRAEEVQGTYTYGIRIRHKGQQLQIDDISPNKATVLRLIRRLKRNPVDMEILHEIVEDYLTEVYSI